MTLGGNVPVDRADVVAILVRADVIEFQAGSFEDRMKISLHLAVDGLAYLNFVSAKLFQEFFQSGIILEALNYE